MKNDIPKDTLAELIQLEHEIAELKDLKKEFRKNNKDGVERRVVLTSMQRAIGKRVRRLREIEESLKKS